MTTLPLKFYENADVWPDNFPETIKLGCELDYSLETRYQCSDPNKEKIKTQLAKSFQNELYGPIKRKLSEAEYFFMRNLSPSADHEKALRLFEEIYAAIPKITHEHNQKH